MSSSRLDSQIISAKVQQEHLRSQPFIELTTCFPACVSSFGETALTPSQRGCLQGCLSRYKFLADELHNTSNLQIRAMLERQREV